MGDRIYVYKNKMVQNIAANKRKLFLSFNRESGGGRGGGVTFSFERKGQGMSHAGTAITIVSRTEEITKIMKNKKIRNKNGHNNDLGERN